MACSRGSRSIRGLVGLRLRGRLMALGSGDVDSGGHHARWYKKRGFGRKEEGELMMGVGWQGGRGGPTRDRRLVDFDLSPFFSQ